MSYSFLHTGLLSPYIGLFLGILSFLFAVVNGIVALISLFGFSLLAYRNARDFFVLVLCPVPLLNSLIQFSSVA